MVYDNTKYADIKYDNIKYDKKFYFVVIKPFQLSVEIFQKKRKRKREQNTIVIRKNTVLIKIQIEICKYAPGRQHEHQWNPMKFY